MIRNLFLLGVCLCFGLTATAQKVRTMEQVDSLVGVLFRTYEKQWKGMTEEYQKADSVRRLAIGKQYDQSQMQCNAQVLALYAKYPKFKGAAQRYFRLRSVLPGKDLEKLYSKLPASARDSDPYAIGIRRVLDTRTVAVGDTVAAFGAMMPRDVAFRFGELSQLKDVLLIFGDWDSMGRDIQLMLQVMYRKVDLSALELVSVFPSTERASFEAEVRAAGVPWVSVSDFKGELSPLNIAFGVHDTPYCVYISKGGRVEEVSLGVGESILSRIQAKSYGTTVKITK